MLEFTLSDNITGYTKEIKMEHSLKAIAEWESTFKTPLLAITRFEDTQYLFYLSCMCIDCELSEYDLEIMIRNQEYLKMINKYMNDSSTATYIRPSGETNNIVMTSEVLYAYMALQGISWDAENWHIQRLLKLLETISALTEKKKPMSQEDIVQERIRLNQERRKKYQSKG